jgi:hypothetical protein
MTIARRRKAGLTGALTLALLIFSACRLVGSGQLHVVNDESGLGANDTVVLAFAPEAGDAWPPAGQAALLVTGTDFGVPPAFGMDGELYLVNSAFAMCPTGGVGPHVFNFAGQAVNILGTLTITDGVAHQWFTIPFTDPQPMRHYLSWALVDVDPVPGSSGDHMIRRCGAMNWVDR